MTASFVQIYNENIFDLLSGDENHLLIREDPKQGGIFVGQLTHVVVQNALQLLEVLSVGTIQRASASTLMVKWVSYF